MANFKDALLDGVEAPETKAPETKAGRAPAKTEAPKPTETAQETETQAPTTTVIAPDTDKIYYGIGLITYSTVVAGLPVYVEAGKPWQGTKYQYDVLKRAKLIQ